MNQRLATAYQDMWNGIVLRPRMVATIEATARRIVDFKPTYDAIVSGTKIPWYFIAIIHYRESTNNFNRHLHNGDPLTAKTKLVPANRPSLPPANGVRYTFEESAADLINLKGYEKIKVWSMSRLLFEFERNNGFGYRRLKVPIHSPYLWNGTMYYKSGKFIADGRYSATAIDKQLGCAVLLKFLTDKTLGVV
jgi:lysozyme family protein